MVRLVDLNSTFNLMETAIQITNLLSNGLVWCATAQPGYNRQFSIYAFQILTKSWTPGKLNTRIKYIYESRFICQIIFIFVYPIMIFTQLCYTEKTWSFPSLWPNSERRSSRLMGSSACHSALHFISMWYSTTDCLLVLLLPLGFSA